MLLSSDFYQRNDVLTIARELLGKLLVTRIDGLYTAGTIVETEAYMGTSDRASHAASGKVTARTQPMYAAGGIAYVYLCYGLHHLFNVVTNIEGIPHAVLIRGIEPVDGVQAMLARRAKASLTPALTAGPGALTKALGIDTSYTGHSLQGPKITIEDVGSSPNEADIVAATRVGVAYAGADALLPYRYCLRGNMYVSKGKGL